jgi:hypothetical protein
LKNTNGLGGFRRPADQELASLGFTPNEALDSEMLANLPNDLARLFYLASLFDRTVHQYVDHSRSPRFGVQETGKAVLAAHKLVFERLSQTPLKELAAQLSKWAAAEPEGFRTVSQEWEKNQTYRLLAPADALDTGASVLLEQNLKLAFELITTGRSRSNPKKQSSSRRID